MRKATIQRVTSETDIQLTINLDGTGKTKLNTGLPFLDHMLSHVAVHGLFDLEIRAEGDLEIDEHHTLEDIALALGQAFDQALGERKGINRMGSALVPMDETLARVALDFSGRPYCVFDSEWNGPSVGGIAATLFRHFFESFAYTARCNLHACVLYGADDHHRAEALFKAFGRALDQVARIDPRREQKIPSTKGII